MMSKPLFTQGAALFSKTKILSCTDPSCHRNLGAKTLQKTNFLPCLSPSYAKLGLFHLSLTTFKHEKVLAKSSRSL